VQKGRRLLFWQVQVKKGQEENEDEERKETEKETKEAQKGQVQKGSKEGSKDVTSQDCFSQANYWSQRGPQTPSWTGCHVPEE
jgi:hypothetical protein